MENSNITSRNNYFRNRRRRSFRTPILYSRSVRAGRRVYHFDVKKSKSGSLFMTISEIKKINRRDGSYYFKRNRIFLYYEDIDKFADNFNHIIDYIRSSITSIQSEPTSYSNYDDNEQLNL